MVSTNIVVAKSRVAPLSKISIPKLELCGAHLLTEIFEYSIPVLNIDRKRIVCWSDSKTVLAWISSHSSKWKPFVSHRTGYILETLPEVKWRYVPSKQNPADCATRGVRSSYLTDNQLWFRGPSFLEMDICERPSSDSKEQTNEEMASRKQVTLITTTPESDVVFTLNERVSRWPRVPLKVEELKEAENCIVRYYQAIDFADMIDTVKNGKSAITNKTLRRLSPFLDDYGVLRVGVRLSKADLQYESQHQFILHKDSPIAKKIVRECHLKNVHAGVTLQIARELVKRVYHHCKICHRYSTKPNSQLMGDLPKFRVNGCYPFYEVGCDYAGPIMYKQHSGRKSPLVKSYISVFICLVTKAIHLELVTDLTTEAFLAALDRFGARRGLCARIHSDNDTNFQGAANKLEDIYRSVMSFESNTNISNFLSCKGIQWKFIPPGAPHFGGVWESAVKSMKYRRTIGLATLNFEQLTTLLTGIEAILNSRPIVQADPDDLPYINPGRFLIRRPLNAVPEADITSLKTSALSKWRLIQQLTQHFWSRWSTEYLLSLQPKAKWLNENSNLCVDDVALLRDENVPHACWKLGRVSETHAGADGLVRVATIKTEKLAFRQPITKLSPLPKDV